MFSVTAAEAELIRTAWITGGEFSAAIEVRRLFKGIDSIEKARECARAIACWTPRPPEAPAAPADAKPPRRRQAG
jgi:hypothetical protein